jgi:hypothetical protein
VGTQAKGILCSLFQVSSEKGRASATAVQALVLHEAVKHFTKTTYGCRIGLWFSKLIAGINIPQTTNVIIMFSAMNCYSHDILVLTDY